MSRVNYVALAAVIPMGIAAVYEAAVALKWIPVGTVSGEGARFEGVFMVAGGWQCSPELSFALPVQD